MPPSRPADADAAAVPLTPDLLRTWPLPLDAGDDKHDRGTVLVIAGSTRTSGAALLAGLAALRAGAGRLQIGTIDGSAPSLAAAVPEALIHGVPSTRGGALDPVAAVEGLSDLIEAADAVLIGPGLEDLAATRDLVVGVLPLVVAKTVVVVDALALSALGGAPATPLRGRMALTPNLQEAAALVSGGSNGLEPRELAARIARDHDCAVTVSGEVAAPDGRCWSARAAIPGLGTSGSGDVLAGLVAGAAARCGDAAQALCWGTYLHVAAGAELRDRIGPVGYFARELLEPVPRLMDEAMPPAEGRSTEGMRTQTPSSPAPRA